MCSDTSLHRAFVQIGCFSILSAKVKVKSELVTINRNSQKFLIIPTMADIKKLAASLAQISLYYSIICMAIELTSMKDHSVNVVIAMTWFTIYLINTLINFWMLDTDYNTLKKGRLRFWFGFTLFLLIIRLVCTNYSHLSMVVLLLTMVVNIYIIFVLWVIMLLINKMDNPTTTDIRSSLTSVAVNNEIISVTADETNIEDLSDNLRSAIDPNHDDLHNGGRAIGSSSSNLNNDYQIVFGTAPTLDDLNSDFTELNNHSYNLSRSADTNITANANANDPPPSYDDVMTPKNEKL
ncbi:uncharacterized protein LOC133843336 [Drosophila sulfurigaster albostrigata]|uniref:uncharacterized protein LOC133843336 n=1 Tax=Drosophila sulfurigaster albostrigata TaxID=89887 RepID=UPI002D21EC98|nr:uncharacterized protein LOC133843336 [Drosophila sulfurigaster albostrigata]